MTPSRLPHVNPWVRLLGLLVAIVVAALFLKVLPPLVVLALFVGGVVYVNHVLTVAPKRGRGPGTAEALGFRVVPAERVGLSGFPFALLHRPGATTLDVMVGTWRGTEVRIFDVETVSAAPVEGLDGTRRFSAAIALVPNEVPHIVVEPQWFLTPVDERPDLPVVDAPAALADAFEVRSADPACAVGFLDEPVTEWLLSREERTAFEVCGRAALIYEPWAPAKERDLLLETVRGFLEAVDVRGE
jgi:hypothetical protein